MKLRILKLHPNAKVPTYVLTFVAASGYESTTKGRCDAEQYALAVKALREPAQARADLEAENARLREALTDTLALLESYCGDLEETTRNQARAALEKTK